MSFLNPVNEPVLRFSSTDADAPQINYNARVAGDVKTVLKACLVTGYGDKASAGWSIVNEVDHVAEFVSPSAAMSDYRLGIDDTSTSSTTWYYQYQGLRVNPVNNQPKKSPGYVNKTSVSNGWELLVTTRGLYLVDRFFNTEINGAVGRVTYFGQVKPSVNTSNDKNIAFWCAGHGAAYNPYQFFSSSSVTHFNVADHETLKFAAANIDGLTPVNKSYVGKTTDLVSALYLYRSDLLIAEHPGLFAKDSADNINLYGVRDDVVNSRSALYVCLGRETGAANIESSVRILLLILDYWEY